MKHLRLPFHKIIWNKKYENILAFIFLYFLLFYLFFKYKKLFVVVLLKIQISDFFFEKKHYTLANFENRKMKIDIGFWIFQELTLQNDRVEFPW